MKKDLHHITLESAIRCQRAFISMHSLYPTLQCFLRCVPGPNLHFPSLFSTNLDGPLRINGWIMYPTYTVYPIPFSSALQIPVVRTKTMDACLDRFIPISCLSMEACSVRYDVKLYFFTHGFQAS